MSTGQSWAAGMIRHRAGCSNPADVRIGMGTFGDELARCRSCAAFGVITPAAAVDQDEQYAGVIHQVEDLLAAVPAPRSSGGSRCRARPDQPVTFRGAGCSHCNQELARSREVKADPRRRIRAARLGRRNLGGTP